jgi:hypothetical protein
LSTIVRVSFADHPRAVFIGMASRDAAAKCTRFHDWLKSTPLAWRRDGRRRRIGSEKGL